MGGNALKHLNVKRVTSNELLTVWQRIQAAAYLYANAEVHLIPWPAATKSDHGDMDVLLLRRGGFALKGLLDYIDVDQSKCVRNGNVTSCPVPFDGGLMQVDFIEVENEDELRHFRLYYSGGGFGAMAGRIADFMGLVFAQEGVRLRCLPDKPWSRDIPLTSDPAVSLHLLGYIDESAITDGLASASEEDLWAFVMRSHWAEPSWFMPENTNADNRSRDRARPQYLRFQEWLRTHYSIKPGKVERWPLEKTREHVRAIVGRDVMTDVNKQREEWMSNKRDNALWGKDAVAAVCPELPDEKVGQVIREMQEHLPKKGDREYHMSVSRTSCRRMAELAAFRVISDLRLWP